MTCTFKDNNIRYVSIINSSQLGSVIIINKLEAMSNTSIRFTRRYLLGNRVFAGETDN